MNDLVAYLKARFARDKARGRHQPRPQLANACTQACYDYTTKYGYHPQSSICVCHHRGEREEKWHVEQQ